MVISEFCPIKYGRDFVISRNSLPFLNFPWNENSHLGEDLCESMNQLLVLPPSLLIFWDCPWGFWLPVFSVIWLSSPSKCILFHWPSLQPLGPPFYCKISQWKAPAWSQSHWYRFRDVYTSRVAVLSNTLAFYSRYPCCRLYIEVEYLSLGKSWLWHFSGGGWQVSNFISLSAIFLIYKIGMIKPILEVDALIKWVAISPIWEALKECYLWLLEE